MKYAVEARVFNSGKIVAKKRAALEGEESEQKKLESCDLWIDVFQLEKDAEDFLRMYKA